jgi:hypothetical protein
MFRWEKRRRLQKGLGEGGIPIDSVLVRNDHISAYRRVILLCMLKLTACEAREE